MGAAASPTRRCSANCAAALTVSLTLAACVGGKSDTYKNSFYSVREELAASTVSFVTELNADTGNSVFHCTLACTRTAEGTELTVLSPKTGEGVTAKVKDGEASLEYDGLELYAGRVGGLDPVSAVPLLLDAYLNGVPKDFFTEKTGDREFVVMRCYVDEETDARLWLDADTMQPLHGELVSHGDAAIVCDFRDFKAQ